MLQFAKLQGYTLPERVTGADLTPLICQWAADNGWRVGFVGGREETHDNAERVVKERYGLDLAGHWMPNYQGNTSLTDPELAAEIKASNVDILLVAAGLPQTRTLDSSQLRQQQCQSRHGRWRQPGLPEWQRATHTRTVPAPEAGIPVPPVPRAQTPGSAISEGFSVLSSYTETVNYCE